MHANAKTWVQHLFSTIVAVLQSTNPSKDSCCYLIIRECDRVHVHVPINKVLYTHQDRMGGDLLLRGSVHVHVHSQ